MQFGKLSSLSIKTKLLVLILGVLCVPFLTLGFLWYQEATTTIKENAEQSDVQLVERLADQLDEYFADVEKATFPLITQPLIKDFMKTDPNDQYSKFMITRDIEKDLLPTITNSRSDIYGFSIITKNGTVSTYGHFSTRERNVGYLLKADGSETFQVRGISRMPDTSLNAVTILRFFRDVETYQTLGLIAIDLRTNKLSSMLSRVKLGETGFLSLIDNEGRIVFSPDQSMIAKPAPALYTDLVPGKPIYRTVSGDKKLVYASKSARTGWTLVSEVPLHELNGRLNKLRNTTIWVGASLVLLALAVISGFSFNLTRNLSHLQRLMKRAENGDLAVKAPEVRTDEIGSLNRSFNKMVGEIRRLIEFVHRSELREKEMEIKRRESSLLAMQSQINPHFLYNTLEVINSYAIIEGVMPISSMATSLADIFRYSVGDRRQVVTLQEELGHINTYFSIQKERYRHLTVELSIPPEDASKVQAVRLMLQPLVENAFIHAYEKYKLRPDFVGISGTPCLDHYLVRVTDRGYGMDPLLAQQYNRLFARDHVEEEEEAPGSEGTSKRIGLLNVHHRLRLTFGFGYGLHIRHAEGIAGTIMEIKLPYITELPLIGDEPNYNTKE